MSSDMAFVIMQIGDKGSAERLRADEVADYVVKPILSEFGIIMHRADRDPTPGQITPQILKNLIAARLVVADLTGRNPNVYYELGVAHSFGKPVIVLCDSNSSLAFDTKDERVIELGESPVLGVAHAEEAKKLLRDSLNVVLAEGYHPTSVVSEVAASRSIDQLAPENPIASELSAIREGISELLGTTKGSAASIPPNIRYERAAMRRLITHMAGQGLLSEADLDSLITADSSGSFDNWVNTLKRANPARSKDGSDGSDEPPFR